MAEATEAPSTAVTVRAPHKTPAATEPLEVSDAARRRYGGAQVRLLELLPPATAHADTSVAAALPAARAHGGQCVLVLDGSKLTGYVDMVDMVIHETEGRMDATLGDLQRPFAGTKEQPSVPSTYRVITPETELAELAAFLEEHAFALVTDAARTRVESVAMAADVERYVDAAPVASTLEARAAEEARKDRSLADMLGMLDQFSPLIPDEVTDFYLERAGFQSEDVRLYVSLLLTQQTPACPRHRKVCGGHCLGRVSVRAHTDECRPEPRAAGPRRRARTYWVLMQDRTRTVLTMDDLSAALGEYGIDARRADAFR